MENLFKILIIVLILNQGCRHGGNEINHFSTECDTLKIRTEKQKGAGLFSLGATDLNFQDASEEFPYTVKYPQNILELRRVQLSTDFRAEEEHYIDVMTGKNGKQKVYIVDENNNNDFTDDSVRICQPIRWNSTDDLVLCKYLISNGQEIVNDSTWVKFGMLWGKLYYGRSEHLISDFSIDNEQFTVGIIDGRTGDFIYGVYPEIALLSHNTVSKDTLLKRDILKLGELINLNGNYYRFTNVSHNGEYVTLVKEENFTKEVGTQVGMIAPDFTCISVAGDTINSSTLHDRIMIIANSCGCGGDRLSTKAFYDIKKEYSDNIHILRLDSKIDKKAKGLQIDMEEKFNSDIYYKFRSAYCTRICYVVDVNNRIIDRFPVSDWRFYLPKLIKP
jgi:hypothetical protein